MQLQMVNDKSLPQERPGSCRKTVSTSPTALSVVGISATA